jgi:hypothetical protein
MPRFLCMWAYGVAFNVSLLSFYAASLSFLAIRRCVERLEAAALVEIPKLKTIADGGT